MHGGEGVHSREGSGVGVRQRGMLVHMHGRRREGGCSGGGVHGREGMHGGEGMCGRGAVGQGRACMGGGEGGCVQTVEREGVRAWG